MLNFKLWIESINTQSINVTIPKGTTLYHGTIESFDTRNVKTGGYDDVFWTTDNTLIARMYIPEKGSYSNISIDYIINPQNNDPETEGIRKSIGLTQQIRKIAWNKHNQGYKLYKYWDGKNQEFSNKFKQYEEESKRNPKYIYENIPDEFFKQWSEAENNKNKYLNLWRNADYYMKKFIIQKMKTFGYTPEGMNASFKRVKQDQNNNLLPADFKQSGKILKVTCNRDFKFYNLAHGQEGDLTDPQYHKINIFRKAEEKGYDGIIINDFAQSKHTGNYGHLAYGFFKNSLKDLTVKQIKNQTHPDIKDFNY